jgi:EAL and modified HD-GYP domain-containing signal transduction protein
MLRAQFAERLARLTGIPEVHNWFLMGLFSLLDAMLDQTIQSALQQIKVAQQISETLCHTAPLEDRMASVYALICRYEQGDWVAVTNLAECLGVPIAEVGKAYLDAAVSMAEFAGLAGL